MKTKITVTAILLFLILSKGTFLFAQSVAPTAKIERLQFNKEVEEAFGYTQAVRVGNTLYLSGYTAAGDVPAQIKGVYEGLSKVLKSYGLSFNDVVKENLYTTDMTGISQHLELRKGFYKGVYPAATWVEVKALLDPNAKLEVELIAVIP